MLTETEHLACKQGPRRSPQAPNLHQEARNVKNQGLGIWFSILLIGKNMQPSPSITLLSVCIDRRTNKEYKHNLVILIICNIP